MKENLMKNKIVKGGGGGGGENTETAPEIHIKKQNEH